jgi:hypothetical protein
MRIPKSVSVAELKYKNVNDSNTQKTDESGIQEGCVGPFPFPIPNDKDYFHFIFRS